MYITVNLNYTYFLAILSDIHFMKQEVGFVKKEGLIVENNKFNPNSDDFKNLLCDMENILSAMDDQVQNICGNFETGQHVIITGTPFKYRDGNIRINANTIQLLTEKELSLWNANIIKTYKKYIKKENDNIL